MIVPKFEPVRSGDTTGATERIKLGGDIESVCGVLAGDCTTEIIDIAGLAVALGGFIRAVIVAVFGDGGRTVEQVVFGAQNTAAIAIANGRQVACQVVFAFMSDAIAADA